jgi:sialate O-acetylesterase
MKTKLTIFCLLALAAGGTVRADVSLPSIFGDHMVLQQGMKLPVWGKAAPGEKVTVSIAGKQSEATADAGGKWMLRLDPLAMTRKPLEMQVKGSGAALVFHDVLVGDVWVCSGQSNMGLGVGATTEAKEIVTDANRPELRLFRVDRRPALTEQDDLPGKWVVCTPESILGGGGKGFSAVAYLFGSEIQNRKNLPVGLILSAVGGTRIQCWTSLEMLQSLKNLGETQKALREFLNVRDNADKYEKETLPALQKEHADWVAGLKEQNNTWQKQKAEASAKNLPAPPQPAPPPEPKRPVSPKDVFSNPTVLFNGMLRPLIPYGIRGVIWYQGEANAYPKLADEYRTLLPAMITGWRTLWQQGDFPFLFVQLPNLASASIEWPVIREAQRKALELPATGMAVTIDVGDPANLHPPIKKPVAERLALATRHVAYGEDIVYSGPLYEAMAVEGGKIRLSFTNTGGGLNIGARPVISPQQKPEPVADSLQGFEVAGGDGIFQPAKAEIQKNTVIVWSDKVAEPKTVRYAWAPNPEPFANLYNRENLPASPFSAENAR